MTRRIGASAKLDFRARAPTPTSDTNTEHEANKEARMAPSLRSSSSFVGVESLDLREGQLLNHLVCGLRLQNKNKKEEEVSWRQPVADQGS